MPMLGSELASFPLRESARSLRREAQVWSSRALCAAARGEIEQAGRCSARAGEIQEQAYLQAANAFLMELGAGGRTERALQGAFGAMARMAV